MDIFVILNSVVGFFWRVARARRDFLDPMFPPLKAQANTPGRPSGADKEKAGKKKTVREGTHFRRRRSGAAGDVAM